jgi:CubicO group peptidase (beta-lactamase class C family)
MKFNQQKKHIAYYIFAGFVAILFSHSHATASVKANATASVTASPTEAWPISAPEAQGLHSKSLFEMMMHIRKNGYNIQSVTIVRNGYLVLDAYVYPFKDGQKHEMHSATKSVTATLIGIAIDKGYIKDVDQTITVLFPNRKIANLDHLKRSISLKDLLMMASGLDCNDASANKWAGTIAMKRSKDWTQYTLNLPMAQNPGEYFHYCNGVSHLLSAIIHESTGMKTIDFAKMYLFDPLGIENTEWKKSPEGTANGFAGLKMEPKDMAKIGLLYLNKGTWDNEQVISAEWIEASTQSYIDGRWNGEDYGYQWWINPAGFYSAVGMYGQAIYVVPGKNLVAVFTSNIVGENMYISGSLLQEYIMPAIVSPEPLPPNPHEVKRLNDLLASIAKAPTQGAVWLTESEGIAKDGIFKRAASPSFQFEYPMSCVKTATRQPDQVMRMKTPSGDLITTSVNEIPRDWKRFFSSIKIEDFGPKAYASWLKEHGSNITVLSNEEISLKCGTKAYKTDIKWLLKNGSPITTNLVSAYKNGKCIYISVHQFKNPELVERIIQSLSFE